VNLCQIHTDAALASAPRRAALYAYRATEDARRSQQWESLSQNERVALAVRKLRIEMWYCGYDDCLAWFAARGITPLDQAE
jgi:hypothetical protein